MYTSLMHNKNTACTAVSMSTYPLYKVEQYHTGHKLRLHTGHKQRCDRERIMRQSQTAIFALYRFWMVFPFSFSSIQTYALI